MSVDGYGSDLFVRGRPGPERRTEPFSPKGHCKLCSCPGMINENDRRSRAVRDTRTQRGSLARSLLQPTYLQSRSRLVLSPRRRRAKKWPVSVNKQAILLLLRTHARRADERTSGDVLDGDANWSTNYPREQCWSHGSLDPPASKMGRS